MFDITPTEWTAILLSLRVATVATLVATPLGVALAFLLARRDFWGKSLLDAAIHLPLVLPPVVTGYLLLLAFGRRGPIGEFLADHFGIVFAFRWTGAALACGVMSFPLLVRPMRLSIEAVDRKLEQAAGTLGAAPWRRRFPSRSRMDARLSGACSSTRRHNASRTSCGPGAPDHGVQQLGGPHAHYFHHAFLRQQWQPDPDRRWQWLHHDL